MTQGFYQPTEEEIREVQQRRDAPVPEAEADGGSMEDLFNVTSEDVIGDESEDLSDLTSGLEPDGDDNDNLDDLVDVSNADVMGTAPEPQQQRYRIKPRAQRPSRPVRRYPPPPSMGGLR